MKKIPLSNGKFAFVDDDKYEEISAYKWHYAKVGYAARKEYFPNSKGNKTPTVYMHRQIIGCEDGVLVDHIDGEKLNNVAKNLRRCTYSQNHMNRQKKDNCSSSYKGVTWDKNRKKWMAKIRLNNKCIYIGRFDSELEAARSYDKKAVELFGEFARPNFQ